jgi:hypothetical protein
MKKGTHIDLSGLSINMVSILSFHHTNRQGSYWNCKCLCGKLFIGRGADIKNGHRQSCGCYNKTKPTNKTHGQCGTDEYKLWREAKYRARHRNRGFNIDISDIVIPEFCPLLDIKLEKGIGKVHFSSPSVDCIDPRLGYVKNNVWVISYKANTMKSNLTLEQLKHFAKVLEDKQREDNSGTRST